MREVPGSLDVSTPVPEDATPLLVIASGTSSLTGGNKLSRREEAFRHSVSFFHI
jgi:hypothetical protein